MKKSLLGSLALVVSVAAGPAMAADMPVKARVKAVPIFSWTGCYFGGNAGAKDAESSGRVDIPPAVGPGGTTPFSTFALNDNGASTFVAGGQVGCDYQTGQAVFGVEVDGDWQKWSSSRGVSGPGFPILFVPGDWFDVSSKWQGSARARLGYTLNPRLLFYGTIGAAWTNVQVGTNFIPIGVFPATIVSDSKTVAGLTLGGGFEVAPADWQHVTLGMEARYTWYGKAKTFSSGLLSTAGGPPFTFAPVTTSVNLSTLEILLKMNYRFNWAGTVVAAY